SNFPKIFDWLDPILAQMRRTSTWTPVQKTLNVTQPGVAFSAGLGRGFVSCLGCVLLRHVFALTGRAVKRLAFPVVNAGLCVNPHLAVAAAGRLRISHLLIGAIR